MSHPIEGLMNSALQNIKSMVDVNTIIGDPINAGDGIVLIPISRVAFGFGAGGSNFGDAKIEVEKQSFGGGAGVNQHVFNRFQIMFHNHSLSFSLGHKNKKTFTAAGAVKVLLHQNGC